MFESAGLASVMKSAEDQSEEAGLRDFNGLFQGLGFRA